MNTIRAQLCLGIISYVLFQGGSSQSPRIQNPGFQQDDDCSTPLAKFRKGSSRVDPSTGPLVFQPKQLGSSSTKRVLLDRGSKPSTFTTHSAPQSTTESLRIPTLVSTVRDELSNTRPSTLHSLQSSPFGPTRKTQTQEATSGQGTSALSYKTRQRSQVPASAVTTSDIISKSTIMDQRTTEKPVFPTPTSESVLTVAAFGVITFIIILVVVVIILVSVVSLRFKCQKNKESEDPQKPDSSGMSESSTANREKDTSITLISMKNINSNNNKGCFTEEKVL